MMRIEDGYYWFRSRWDADATFIAKREDGAWYLPGIDGSVATLSPEEMICPVEQPRETVH